MKEKEVKESIGEALGIGRDWANQTGDKVEETFAVAEKLSDIMEVLAIDIKQEEFGEGNYELTAYEKKLVYAGYLISQELNVMQAMAAKKELMMDLLLGMLGKGDLPKDILGDE